MKLRDLSDEPIVCIGTVTNTRFILRGHVFARCGITDARGQEVDVFVDLRVGRVITGTAEAPVHTRDRRLPHPKFGELIVMWVVRGGKNPRAWRWGFVPGTWPDIQPRSN